MKTTNIIKIILLILFFHTSSYALKVTELNIGNYNYLYEIALSHNGELLAIGVDRTDDIKIYNLKNESYLMKLDTSGFEGGRHISFSPNDKFLVSGQSGYNAKTRTWNMKTGQWVRYWEGSGYNTVVKFLDNNHFIYGDSNSKYPFRICNINTGKYRSIKTPKRVSVITNIQISKNKKMVAMQGGRGFGSQWYASNYIYIYNPKNRKLIKKLKNDSEYMGNMIFCSNNKFIANIANEEYEGSHINIWNIKKNRIIKKLINGEKYESFRSIDWSKDGKYIAAGTEYNHVYIWEALTGKLIRKIGDYKHSSVDQIKFSNDNLKLIVKSEKKGFIKIYDIRPVVLSIKNLINSIYEEKLLNSPKLHLVSKPQKKYIAENKIIKDEFETTKAFKTRQQQEKERVKQVNLKIDETYIFDIKKWKLKNAKLEKEHQLKLIEFESNKDKMYDDSVQESVELKYGKSTIKYANYNADKEVFDIAINLDRGNYKQKFEIPVGLKYAKKFKGILTAKEFKPTVEFKLVNNKIKAVGIEQIKDPELLVKQKNELDKARYSKSKLEDFIKKYPNSNFVIEAKGTIKKIELQEIQAEKERKRRQEKEEKQRKIREAHYAKKYVGDKVCKDGITAIILSITITAYVEKVNGNSIQLRISDTEGTSPHMNGVTLYRNTLIWDDYSSWYKCN